MARRIFLSIFLNNFFFFFFDVLSVLVLGNLKFQKHYIWFTSFSHKSCGLNTKPVTVPTVTAINRNWQFEACQTRPHAVHATACLDTCPSSCIITTITDIIAGFLWLQFLAFTSAVISHHQSGADLSDAVLVLDDKWSEDGFWFSDIFINYL